MSGPSAQDLAVTLGRWADGFAQRGTSFGTGLDILVFLLALRMDYERKLLPYNAGGGDPSVVGWEALLGRSGTGTTRAIAEVRATLETSPTTLGMLSRVPSIPEEPAHLTALIAQIDAPERLVGHPWTSALPLLAEAFDRLLVEAGNDATIPLLPTNRALADAIATVLRPRSDDAIVDVGAGSGGLLLATRAKMTGPALRSELARIRDSVFRATELRPDMARWCAFNLFIHGIGTLEAAPLVTPGDSLANPAPASASLVVTNPEFGRQDADLAVALTAGSRSDITVTGNRHLDMLQHVVTMLRPGGRAAVILPDNVLFEAGAGTAVRRRLLDTCDLHTILRLPTGISRKSGVKANVLFFDKKPAREEPWTTATWFYDLRTNQHFTLKRHRISQRHLQPFVDAYQADDRELREESERFRRLTYAEIVSREHVNLDITWLRDDNHVDAADLPPPDVLARELAEDLLVAARELDELADALEAHDASSGT